MNVSYIRAQGSCYHECLLGPRKVNPAFMQIRELRICEANSRCALHKPFLRCVKDLIGVARAVAALQLFSSTLTRFQCACQPYHNLRVNWRYACLVILYVSSFFHSTNKITSKLCVSSYFQSACQLASNLRVNLLPICVSTQSACLLTSNLRVKHFVSILPFNSNSRVQNTSGLKTAENKNDNKKRKKRRFFFHFLHMRLPV